MEKNTSRMKFIYILAFGSLNLLATNILAQKDEMQFGLHFLASDDVNIHLGGSFGYFQAKNEHQSLGAKLSFGTDGLEPTDLKHYFLQMDFLSRWATSGSKGRCYADLGISAMGETDRVKPGTYVIECAVGMTNEQLAVLNRLYREGTSGNRFYLGLTAGVGLERRLGSQFLIGVATSCHLYRIQQELRPQIRPSLSLTRQF